jgi:hypothetical protein
VPTLGQLPAPQTPSLTASLPSPPAAPPADRVDEFLDESSFLGTNKLVREQLRTVAGCSTLVELLHNSRKSLSVQQVRTPGGGALKRPECHDALHLPSICTAASAVCPNPAAAALRARACLPFEPAACLLPPCCQMERIVGTMASWVFDAGLNTAATCTAVRLLMNLIEALYQQWKRPELDYAHKSRVGVLCWDVLGVVLGAGRGARGAGGWRIAALLQGSLQGRTSHSHHAPHPPPRPPPTITPTTTTTTHDTAPPCRRATCCRASWRCSCPSWRRCATRSRAWWRRSRRSARSGARCRPPGRRAQPASSPGARSTCWCRCRRRRRSARCGGGGGSACLPFAAGTACLSPMLCPRLHCADGVRLPFCLPANRAAARHQDAGVAHHLRHQDAALLAGALLQVRSRRSAGCLARLAGLGTAGWAWHGWAWRGWLVAGFRRRLLPPPEQC